MHLGKFSGDVERNRRRWSDWLSGPSDTLELETYADISSNTCYLLECIASTLSSIGAVKALGAAGLPLMMMTPVAPPPPPTGAPAGVRLYQPREEGFGELIFPGFDPSAFIWKVSAFQIAEFLLSLAIGQDHGIPSTCTLYKLGASWGPAIAGGQLWRLFLPMTLHANMMHLFFNIFFQLRIGFGMEKQFGVKKFFTLYVLCGMIGNLISVAVDPFKLAVGASTAGFGLIGVWLAEILLSWHVLGPNRDRTLTWVAFMLCSVILMSTATVNIDMFGHLGGALAGFLVAVVMSEMPEQHRPEWYATAKGLCAAGLMAVVVGCGLKIALLTPHSPIPACGNIGEMLRHISHS